MGEPLRYILVGTGGWGRTWCQEFLPRLADLGKARCVAAADVSAASLTNAQQFLGLSEGQCHTDVAGAFDTPADFAIVVVPPAHHEAMVDLALARGLHILSEKPMADTMGGCCRIYRKVKAAGVKMAVTMSHRFDQDKQSLEAAIKGGQYGRLNYIVHRFTHNCRAFGSWGADFRHQIADALLIEGTVHHFDMLRALSGADARRVYARTWNPPWGEFAGDSTALIMLEMTNGVRCLYEGAKANASTLNGWDNDYLRAECEHGTLELDHRWLRVLRGGAWERPLAQDLPLLSQPVWSNAWLAEMFCDWLAGRRGQHPTNLEDNLQCAALLFAAIESAHSDRPVDVQEYVHRHLTTEDQ